MFQGTALDSRMSERMTGNLMPLIESFVERGPCLRPAEGQVAVPSGDAAGLLGGSEK